MCARALSDTRAPSSSLGRENCRLTVFGNWTNPKNVPRDSCHHHARYRFAFDEPEKWSHRFFFFSETEGRECAAWEETGEREGGGGEENQKRGYIAWSSSIRPFVSTRSRRYLEPDREHSSGEEREGDLTGESLGTQRRCASNTRRLNVVTCLNMETRSRRQHCVSSGRVLRQRRPATRND